MAARGLISKEANIRKVYALKFGKAALDGRTLIIMVLNSCNLAKIQCSSQGSQEAQRPLVII